MMANPLTYYLIPLIIGVGAYLFLTARQQGSRHREHQQSRHQRQYAAPCNGTCTICLDEYNSSYGCEELKCGHIFHRDCYRLLLENGGPIPKCPNCKLPVF